VFPGLPAIGLKQSVFYGNFYILKWNVQLQIKGYQFSANTEQVNIFKKWLTIQLVDCCKKLILFNVSVKDLPCIA
jgi:hypothetical protein